MIVNGKRYIGYVRSETRPDTASDDEAEIFVESPGETTKEQNRCLLAQHRELKQRPAKGSKSRNLVKH